MHKERSETVVVVGSVNHDHFTYVQHLPSRGETVLAQSSRSSVGGKGANQAFAAARVGASVTFVGQVGEDPSGAIAREELAAVGIGIDRLVVVAGFTGRAHVTVERSGENTVVVAPGANGSASIELVTSARALLASAGVVLAQGELPAAVIDEVASVARQAGVRFVLNLAPVVGLTAETLRTADPLIVNESEAATLLGEPGDEGVDLAAARTMVADLAALTSRSAVLTLGSLGAVVSDGTDTWHQAPFVPESVVDTTGAGDAFTGVLCAFLAQGSDLRTAVSAGAAAGGAAVSKRGTTASYPSRSEVLAHMASSDVSASTATQPTANV